MWGRPGNETFVMWDVCKWEKVVLWNTIMYHTTPSCLPHNALHSPSNRWAFLFVGNLYVSGNGTISPGRANFIFGHTLDSAFGNGHGVHMRQGVWWWKWHGGVVRTAPALICISNECHYVPRGGWTLHAPIHKDFKSWSWLKKACRSWSQPDPRKYQFSVVNWLRNVIKSI